MKKNKKHNFKYQDPINKAEGTKKLKTKEFVSEVPEKAIMDFKRASLTILIFIALIVALYLFRDQLKLNELVKLLKF